MVLVDLSAYLPLSLLLKWLGIANVGGCGAMLADKVAAIIDFDRLSERSLVFVAILGGFAGITLGGLFFHHKTSKGDFWVPVGTSWMVWIAFLVVYFFPWVLTL